MNILYKLLVAPREVKKALITRLLLIKFETFPRGPPEVFLQTKDDLFFHGLKAFIKSIALKESR